MGLGLFAWTVVFPAFADGRNDPEAYSSLALAAAVMAFVAILACSIGTHGLIPHLRRPNGAFSTAGLLRDLRNALSSQPYRVLLAATMLGAVSMGFDEAFRLYMTTYFWGFDDGDQAVLMGMILLAVPAAFLGARQISLRFDKRRAAIGIMTFAIFFGPSLIILRLLDVLPPNGDPIILPLVAGHAAVSLAGFLAIMILMRSMLQDSVDENDLRTGVRQEGVFVSAMAFTGKAVSGFGNLLGGIALQWIDFPTRAAAAAVSPSKIALLGWAVGPAAMVLQLAALGVLYRYPITRARYAEIAVALRRNDEASRD